MSVRTVNECIYVSKNGRLVNYFFLYDIISLKKDQSCCSHFCQQLVNVFF
jgi:hypothetical protein